MQRQGFQSVELSGWGRFPVEQCHLFRPEKRAELAALLASGQESSYTSHGLGRSYGDAALNRDGGVISHVRLNRLLGFDSETGVLECEAGVSLAEIVQFFLPRGFFLPVTPGTKFATVGGGIAADVHGKNHHRDGTLTNFILDFKLLTPSGQVLLCSPSVNPEIFWATAGGMGLTGIILSARLRLQRVESAYVLVDYQKARNLDEALQAMTESDQRYQYSVAWIDCLATGRAMGRSVLMRGNHATKAQLSPRLRNPLALPQRGGWSVPLDLPSTTLNRFSVGAFNAFFYALHRTAANRIVDLEKFFYPLDAINHWNRLYGRRGFVQYQVALPLESGRQALVTLLERLGKSHRASFLAVLKRFGEGNPGLLSFPLRGYTLALDLPVSRGLVPFMQELDRLVLEHAGRVYLAKDAVLTKQSFAAMYPKLGQFRAIKQTLDPKGILSSSMARRLGIMDA
jgi:FAD/FMN-containing dehydrogenase